MYLMVGNQPHGRGSADRRVKMPRVSQQLETSPTSGELAARISNAVVSIVRSHLGKGPERVRTTLDEHVAVVVLRGGFSLAERTLHAHGRDEVVEETRFALQEIMKRELIAAVESITGREVEVLMGSLDQKHEVQVEVFLFANGV